MNNTTRVHRVGSVTAGVSMVAMGVIFLLHIFFDIISYELICKLWPLILIGLGVEILLFNVSDKKFVYDKAAIFLLIMMSLFAAGMAMMNEILNHCNITL